MSSVEFDTLLSREQERGQEPAAPERSLAWSCDGSPAAVLRIAPDGRAIEGNLAAARLLGLRSASEIPGRDTDEFYSAKQAQALLGRLLHERALSGIEMELRRADGTRVWVLAHLRLTKAVGVGPAIEVTLLDIAARKRAEERLWRLNRLYRLLSRMNQACVRISERSALGEEICRIAVEDGGFRLVWLGLCDEGGGPLRPSAFCGFEDGELAGLELALTPAEVRSATAAVLAAGECLVINDVASVSTPEPWVADAARRGYGSLGAFPILAHKRLIGSLHLYALAPGFFDTQVTEVLRMLGEDIGSALAAIDREAARREAEQRWAQSRILESITDSFVALDHDWHLEYVNRRTEQLVGRGRHDLLGNRVWDEFPGLAGTAFEENCRLAAAEQRPIEFTFFYERFRLWLNVHAYPSVNGLSLYIQDVTARKELEEQLGQSQRLEALGRLAGGVAHDFNNLLTIIGGYGQMVLQSLEATHPLHRDMEAVVEAADRASALTRQLLAFSRRQMFQPKIIDLNRLISKMDKMLRRVIGEDVELRLALRADAGRVKADPAQLEQVLMNLAVNARDAMPTGGRLSVATEGYEYTGAGGPPGLVAGSYLLLTVTDSGCGMDDHTRRHLFEPFFTTKGKGNGTGLGLATVYGIVKQSGGEIWVESEPGRGSCFRIAIPRANKTPKRPRAKAARRPRDGHETLLLVEDDPEVRRLAAGMLQRLGYRVFQAPDGPAALALWPEIDMPDLLVTDIIMPQMSGRDLADKLHSMQRGLKVLFISGYTHDVIERHGVLESEVTVLHKPFTHQELGTQVRRVLDGAPEK